MAGERMTDEERKTSLEQARFMLRELERQHAQGFDSLSRFHRERMDAMLLLEQDAELRERRARDAATFDATVVVFGEDGGKIRRVFLSGRDVEALRDVRTVLGAPWGNPKTETERRHNRMVALLDKLLSSGGGR